jgi:hypothetical protein
MSNHIHIDIPLLLLIISKLTIPNLLSQITDFLLNSMNHILMFSQFPLITYSYLQPMILPPSHILPPLFPLPPLPPLLPLQTFHRPSNLLLDNPMVTILKSLLHWIMMRILTSWYLIQIAFQSIFNTMYLLTHNRQTLFCLMHKMIKWMTILSISLLFPFPLLLLILFLFVYSWSILSNCISDLLAEECLQ